MKMIFLFLLILIFENSHCTINQYSIAGFDRTGLVMFDHSLSFEDAQSFCKKKKSNLVAVGSAQTLVLLKSLALKKNREELLRNISWNEKLWTTRYKKNLDENCSNAELIPSVLEINFTSTFLTNQTLKQADLQTRWLNSTQCSLNSFVCETDVDSCSQSSLCQAPDEELIAYDGFDVCSCKESHYRDQEYNCRAKESTFINLDVSLVIQDESNVSKKMELILHSKPRTYSDAISNCKLSKGKLISLESELRTLAIKSLILNHNSKSFLPWSDAIWMDDQTSIENCSAFENGSSFNAITFEVNSQLLKYPESFYQLSSSLTNKSPIEKHVFVCQKDLDECSSQPSCGSQGGVKILVHGFEVCSCPDGNYRISNSACEEGSINGFLKEIDCPPTIINGFYFNSSKIYSMAYSNETCKTNSSSASVLCMPRSGINGVLVGEYDENFFAEVNCSISLADINTISLSNETLVDFSIALNELSHRQSSNLNVENQDILAHAINSISQFVTDNNYQIPPYMFSNLLQTVSVLGQTPSFQSNKSANLVKSVEYLMDNVQTPQLSSDEITPDLSFRSPNIYVQIQDHPENVASNLNLVGQTFQANELFKSVSVNLPTEGIKETSQDMKVGVIMYNDVSFFSSINISYPIIGIRIAHLDNVVLKSSLSIGFSKLNNSFGKLEDTRRNKEAVASTVKFLDKRCVYWNFERNLWSSEGCCFNFSYLGPPTCECSHLTNFVVLLSIYEVPSDVRLDILTRIGCGINILLLLIVLLLHILNSKSRARLSTKIQLHIFSNFLVVYAIFLVGIDKADLITACRILTALLHYFFLSTFMWISVFSNNVYRSLVKVFDVVSSNYLWKASIFGYGIPACVLVANIALTAGYYDEYLENNQICETSELNRPTPSSYYFGNTMCWITQPSLYFSFLLIISITLLHNLVVVLIVSKKAILQKRELRSTANQKSALKKLSVVCTMSWSLGIPWILGYFLLVDSDSTYQAVVGWLFVILLTLHGFVYFYITCIKNQEMFNFWFLPIKKRLSRREYSSDDNSTSIISNSSKKTLITRL